MKKVIIGLLFVASVAASATTSAQNALLIQIEPREVQQGRTAIIRLTGQNITDAQASFNGLSIPFYLAETGEWIGFLPVDMSAQRGDYPIDIVTWTDGVPNRPIQETVTVAWGGFSFQDIPLPPSLDELLDPEVNRQETNTLLRAYSRRTPKKMWVGNFQRPVFGPSISDFGGIRNYNNGQYEGRHTGADYRAMLNESITAAGHGRVVFAQFLPVRGNHVIIDHGWGVLTGYSHLNEVFVVPGQRVLQGDVIGGAGTTGRSQGVHIHFEMAVNGVWIDPPQFFTLSIPEAGR